MVDERSLADNPWTVSCPDYDLLVDRELIVIRWRRPTHASASTLHFELVDHAERLGVRPLIAIIIGPDCPPPDHRTRDALLRGHDRLHGYSRDTRLVILGDSLRQRVMRSMVTGMTLAAGLRGKAFHVDRSLSELLVTVSAELGRDPAATLAQLVDAGLIESDEIPAIDRNPS